MDEASLKEFFGHMVGLPLVSSIDEESQTIVVQTARNRLTTRVHVPLDVWVQLLPRYVRSGRIVFPDLTDEMAVFELVESHVFEAVDTLGGTWGELVLSPDGHFDPVPRSARS